MIDVSDIEMIRVVTELGSINRAAEQLNVSQPTLSKKISRLEHKLKLQLFARQSVGMVPTDVAKFVLAEGENLHAQLANMERQLQLMSDMVGGCIRIGVGPIVEQVILSKALLDFAEADYKFNVAISTAASHTLINQLRNSEIDIALGPFHLDEVGDEFATPLIKSEPIVFTVRKGHPLLSMTSLDIAEVMKFGAVSPSIPQSMMSQVDDGGVLGGFEPKITCENYSVAKNIVLNSDMMTGGPESVFHHELKSGELVQLPMTSEYRWYCSCLVKSENLMMPSVREVVKLFSRYMTPAY